MTDNRKTFAVVLMKCKPGDESAIRKVIETQRAKAPHVCLRRAHAPAHKKACKLVKIVEAAYCFGPFDFLFVVQSSQVHHIERFIVECVRSDASLIQDTQTILGITV